MDFGTDGSSQNRRGGLAIPAKCQAALFVFLLSLIHQCTYSLMHTVNMAGSKNIPLLFSCPRVTNTPHISQNCTCVSVVLSHQLNKTCTQNSFWQLPFDLHSHSYPVADLYSILSSFPYCLVKFDICKHLACLSTHGIDNMLLKEVSLEQSLKRKQEGLPCSGSRLAPVCIQPAAFIPACCACYF